MEPLLPTLPQTGDVEVVAGDPPSNELNNRRREKEVINAFLDELETRILDPNDKLYLRESHQPISEPFSNSGHQISTVFEILDEKGQNVLFKLGVGVPEGNASHYIIATTAGHQVIVLKKNGCLFPSSEVEGGGLLTFTQSTSLLGYTLHDPYKSLLKIRTNWIRYLTFLLFIPGMYGHMSVINLDGSPCGSIVFKKHSEKGSLCLTFIRGLDRKAKYMLFAACFLPLSTYFCSPGKLRRSLLLAFVYITILVLVGCILFITLS